MGIIYRRKIQLKIEHKFFFNIFFWKIWAANTCMIALKIYFSNWVGAILTVFLPLNVPILFACTETRVKFR